MLAALIVQMVLAIPVVGWTQRIEVEDDAGYAVLKMM